MALRRAAVPVEVTLRGVRLSFDDLKHLEGLLPLPQSEWRKPYIKVGSYEVDKMDDLSDCPDSSLPSMALRFGESIRITMVNTHTEIRCSGTEADDILAVNQAADFLRSRKTRRVAGFDTPARVLNFLAFLVVNNIVTQVAFGVYGTAVGALLWTLAGWAVTGALYLWLNRRTPGMHPIALRSPEEGWWARHDSKIQYVTATVIGLSALGATLFFNLR